MACGAVEHAISLGVNRIVVGADWVAGTQPRALEGGLEDAPKRFVAPGGYLRRGCWRNP